MSTKKKVRKTRANRPRKPAGPKFIVRHYDGFDNDWIDVSKPVSQEEAERILAAKTAGGTKNTSYGDIDYYRIFPADTTMLHSAAGEQGLLRGSGAAGFKPSYGTKTGRIKKGD